MSPDLHYLQSDFSIAAKCPADISGLSNHNAASVHASNWTQIQCRHNDVYMKTADSETRMPAPLIFNKSWSGLLTYKT
jgi:hypothetical protein